MGKLYVIGNGFDLNYGLPTRTDNFIDELKEIKFERYASAWEAYLNYGVDWSTFEESLSDINLNEIDDEVVTHPDYTADSEAAREGVILSVRMHTDALCEARETAFRNMIAKAEEQIEGITISTNPGFFTDDDEILSFNYTSTIETLFDYKKTVFHIHGRYSDDEELVFGFKTESQEYYSYKSKLNSEKNKSLQEEKQNIKKNNSLSDEEKEYQIEEVQYCYEQNWNDSFVDKEYEEILSFYEANKKTFQYDRLKQYLDGLCDIEEVVVLGHSMQDVDREYFDMIEEIVMPSRWIVSARDLTEIPDKQAVCATYPFKDKCTVELMSDILV